MDQSQHLQLDQRLSMRLSAQQLRFVKLLELNAPELDDAVARELDDNPALEKVDDAPLSFSEESKGAPVYSAIPTGDWSDYDFAQADNEETLYDSLLRQLEVRSMPDKVRQAAQFIIGSLDGNGYLRRSLPQLANDMAFGPGIEASDEEMREALKTVQDLDPGGVGATSLQECLLLQLRKLSPSKNRDNAEEILQRQFEAFSMKHTHKILAALRLTKEEVKDAIDLIVTLNPKPGAAFDSPSDRANVVIPDIVVHNDDGTLQISLNNRIPELAVSNTFEEAVREMGKEGGKKKKKGMEFIASRYNDAREFIRILGQRQQTLLTVMAAIMKIQSEYFATEDVYRLKPMMLKDVSAVTGLDFSVISRATANKFVALPWGIYPLRFFFSDSIGEDNGEETDALTNRKIEAEIKSIVDAEDKSHPLSDEKIKDMMLARGYDVSRRTVAKYRDRQDIPVARLRRERLS